MTGHENVVFSTQESENLRNYLIGGGFLHIDDNYGMDKFIRPEMKKVFLKVNLLSSLSTTLFTHLILNLAMDYQKFTNTTGSHPKDLDCSTKTVWSVFTPMKAILAMAGKTAKYITIRQPHD